MANHLWSSLGLKTYRVAISHLQLDGTFHHQITSRRALVFPPDIKQLTSLLHFSRKVYKEDFRKKLLSSNAYADFNQQGLGSLSLL